MTDGSGLLAVGGLVTLAWVSDPEELAGAKNGLALDMLGASAKRLEGPDTWAVAGVRDFGLHWLRRALTVDTYIYRVTKGGALVTEAGPRFMPELRWRLRDGRRVEFVVGYCHAGPGKKDKRLVIGRRRDSGPRRLPVDGLDADSLPVLADLLEAAGDNGAAAELRDSRARAFAKATPG